MADCGNHQGHNRGTSKSHADRGRPDLIDIEGAVNQNCCSFGNLQYLNRAAFVQLPVVTASAELPGGGMKAVLPCERQGTAI